MTGLSVPVIGSLLSVASESYPYYGDNLSESIQLCKGIMAPTRMVAQGVRNYLGFQGEIFVIPWVVMGPSHRIEYSGYPLSFGCVSRLSEEKGIEFLLASFRQIQNAMPSSELHIYGDGPERERVQRIAQILGLQRLSIERAFEPVYGMAKIASRHSVFLFPSLIESFGLASAEIMAFSRIPIMTDVGLAEYLPSTLRRRFVVSRGDASEMAKRALQIVKNSSRLEVFGLKFHDLWQNRFSPEAVVPHVVKMYGALTDRMK
jgi:glycosyltransferase involved in cell wall biosynthesis